MDIQYSPDVLCKNKNSPSKICHADIHAVDINNYNSDSEISQKNYSPTVDINCPDSENDILTLDQNADIDINCPSDSDIDSVDINNCPNDSEISQKNPHKKYCVMLIYIQ